METWLLLTGYKSSSSPCPTAHHRRPLRQLIGCLHDEANMKQMYWIYTCTTCAL